MIVVIMGPVGSGKSTQAQLLSESLGAYHLNTGDLLYYASQGADSRAREIAKKMEVGGLVDDETVTELVNEYFEEKPGEDVVMEGFPRTVSQAEALKIDIDRVFYINISDKEAVKRLLGRSRPDDTEDIIRKRLEIYHQETEPLLAFYKDSGVLVEIDGEYEIAQVAKNIASRLEGVSGS